MHYQLIHYADTYADGLDNSAPSTSDKLEEFLVAPSDFGSAREMPADATVTARLVLADPPNGALPLRNAQEVRGNIALIERGGGQFVNVVRRAQVSSYYYTCVLMLLYMCPHTTIHVSSCYYICVLILLYMCPQPDIFFIYLCPQILQ